MTTSTDTLPDGTRIGRVALRVADLGATTAFYRDVVGLSVLRRDDDRAVLGVGGDPSLVLEAAPDAPERDPAAAGLFHVAVRVPSRAALGDALGRIREGPGLDGASDHLVSEALYFTDPEGNGVEVYRDRPRGEWPVFEDGTIGMTTDPLDLEGVAAAAGGDPTAPPDTDVGHVHLEVTSLSDFGEFYVGGLGFESVASMSGARFVSAGGYHHHVGANVWEGRTRPAGGDARGLAWFEVLVPDRGALDAVRERLRGTDRGGSVSGGDDAGAGGGGDDAIEVADPDGVRVRLRVED